MKLCKDCKHFAWPTYGAPGLKWKCYALKDKPNPTTGEKIEWIAADVMRMSLCGWDFPRLFDPKDVK